MEIKRKSFIFAALFLLLTNMLCAQETIITDEDFEAEEKGYYVEYTDGNIRFVQRLKWYGGEYILNYEVLILVDNNGYKEYSREKTEDNFLLVSLPPGKYRYCVIPFDLLGKRGETSEWIDFEVKQALQPVIESFTPYAFHLDQNFERVLTVTGANFMDECNIFLQSKTDFLVPERVIIVGGTEVQIYFRDMELITGEYDIHIRNPGGLEDQLGGFTVDYMKPMDFFLKLAWTPGFSGLRLYDYYAGQYFFPAGFSFTFQTVNSRRGILNGGVELAASLLFMDSGISLLPDDDFLVIVPDIMSQASLLSFDLNFVMQRRFNRERTIFSFRFGVGVVLPIGFESDMLEDDFIIQLNLAADFLFRLNNYFFLEAGLDYNYYVSSPITGIVRPRLGLSFKF